MKNFALAAALLATSAFVTPVSAASIDLATLVGSYDIQDDFNPVGSFFDNDYFASSAFTVKFTDLYVVGDEYNIYVNGVWVGFAGVPSGSTGTYNSDPDSAYASGDFAHGLISLSAGDTLSFQIAAIPSGYSDGTIAVTALAASPTPEPATWALMLGGFGAIGGAMRSRRKTAVTFA